MALNITNVEDAALLLQQAFEQQDAAAARRRPIPPSTQNDESDDDDDVDESFDEIYEELGDKYIEANTRLGYEKANARFILYLHREFPTYLNEDTKIKMDSATDTTTEALNFAKSVTTSYCPIKLADLPVKVFTKFLYHRAESMGKRFLSKSGIGGYRSALKDMFKRSGIEVSNKFENELKKINKCLVKSYQKEKGVTGQKMTEGKEAMPFALYCKLCDWMLNDTGSESIFGRAFLTLTWNLMCRSRNTVYIHRDHITWTDDAMTIQFAHMKTDMQGFDSAYKRYIYANSQNPKICAVNATACYLLFSGERNDGMLFDSNSYSRFRRYMSALVKEHEEELINLGISPKDIGVHSIRKGAATYCCTGTTDAPHIAAICNRAGWTMGKVKDAYIKYGSAGDQHVGRVICGVNVHSPEFSCTPPHFRVDNTGLDDLTSTDAEIYDVLKNVFHTKLCLESRALVRMMLATLFHGYEIIHAALPNERSPLRGNVFFSHQHTAEFKRVKDSVEIIYGWEVSKYWNTHVTGIPTNIRILVGQEGIKTLICNEIQSLGKT